MFSSVGDLDWDDISFDRLFFSSSFSYFSSSLTACGIKACSCEKVWVDRFSFSKVSGKRSHFGAIT